MTVRKLLLKHLHDFRVEGREDLYVPFRAIDVEERLRWCSWRRRAETHETHRHRFERVYRGRVASVDMIYGGCYTWLVEPAG